MGRRGSLVHDMTTLCSNVSWWALRSTTDMTMRQALVGTFETGRARGFLPKMSSRSHGLRLSSERPVAGSRQTSAAGAQSVPLTVEASHYSIHIMDSLRRVQSTYTRTMTIQLFPGTVCSPRRFWYNESVFPPSFVAQCLSRLFACKILQIRVAQIVVLSTRADGAYVGAKGAQ